MWLDPESFSLPITSNRQRDLNRDVEFFCNELVTITAKSPPLGVDLSQALHAIGAASIDSGVGYATVFIHLNELLKWASSTLSVGTRKTTDKKAKEEEQSRNLILSGLYCQVITC